ncbi:MAG: hypothetical protein KTR24_04755 [Saprospiraceae bacterium]|nr:hypothetical protein [Saprospiraceae bacterium]
MVRIAVCTCPEFSHTIAILPMVRSLVHEGADVYLFSYSQYSKYLDQTGARLFHLDRIVPHDYLWKKGEGHVLDVEVMRFKQCRLVSSPLLKQFELVKFDLVITEQICLWGKLLAARFSLPMVVTSTVYDPAHYHDEFRGSVSWRIRRRPLRALFKLLRILLVAGVLARKFRVSHRELSDLFHKREADLYIHYIPKDPFYPDAPTHEKIHMAPDDSIRRVIEGSFTVPSQFLEKRIIYISMGTVHTGLIDVLWLFWEAFKDSDYFVVFSLGEVLLDQLPPMPSHYMAEKYVSQLSILDQAHLFITHAGANSFLEGINSLTPMLAIPQAYDQFYMADMLDRLGIGKRLAAEHLEVAKIQDTVRTVFDQHGEYLTCLQEARQKLHEGMVSAQAAHQVIRLADQHKLDR